MRIGVILPTFRADAGPALAAAEEAEAAGLHGVFAYNHLWPMGQPGRPAISPFPLLAMVAARTRRVAVGTLVARVGLTPEPVLVDELLTLDAVSRGRLVAAIGTGDAKSAAENLAYGVAFASARDRRARCADVTRSLLDAGVPVWIGGGSPATNAIAPATGAALNLWAATPSSVAAAASAGEVTWAGRLAEGVEAAAVAIAALEAAGATWVVASWPGSCAPLVAAASTAGVTLG